MHLTPETTRDRALYHLEDRFDGYSLCSVHEIAWPLYEHTISIVVPTSVCMNIFEHALLSLLMAGVSAKEEALQFLGVGPRFFEQLIRVLSGSDGRFAAVLIDNGNEILPNSDTSSALSRDAKYQLETRQSSAFRDAIFGLPMAGFPFTLVESAEAVDSTDGHQFSPLKDPSQDPASAWHRPFLDTLKEGDIASATVSEVGALRWSRLLLASYSAESPKSGRLLVFNPADENRPLPELSEYLEKAILSGITPQPYRPDLIDSFPLWCLYFRENLQRDDYRKQIARHERTLEEAAQQENKLLEQIADSPQLELLREQNRALKEELQRLHTQLAQAPKFTHIEVGDHPVWFRKALEGAEDTLIIISPWITIRVLGKWLPSIRKALDRECEIWIGHGMPRSANYNDNTDQLALDELDGLGARTGKLHRVGGLDTHAKILICDEKFFVSGSYNWLSFDGGSDCGRSEHGMVHSGSGVAEWKEYYLNKLRRGSSKAR